LQRGVRGVRNSEIIVYGWTLSKKVIKIKPVIPQKPDDRFFIFY